MYYKLALGNVKKSIRDYGVYFLTLVFGVCVFYAFNSITQQSEVLDLGKTGYQMINLLSSIIGGVSVFIAIILGFLIIYASRYLIRRRKQEFGTYLLLGMPTGKVSRIIVYETLFVGLLSLIVGLLVGIVLSQIFLYVTAALFEIKMESLLFIFSPEALILTLVCFGVIFFIALLFNTISINRYRLIDLINARRKNESIKLRSLPLSVALFLVSLVLIGIAYYLLIENGLLLFTPEFIASTILVCVGTGLLFYSLSGFLLRAVQGNKRLYLSGLNMFTLRQLNSKINTTFLSISVVCMALFLAITSTCGGFALNSSFSAGVREATPYDASLKAYYGGVLHINAELDYNDPWFAAAAANNYDMAASLSQNIENWDELVSKTAQITFYQTDISLQKLVLDTEYESALVDQMKNDTSPLLCVSLSDYNAQRELRGLEPVKLEANEFFFWSDHETTSELIKAYIEQHDSLTVFGETLYFADEPLSNMVTETAAQAMNYRTLVLPDERIPSSAQGQHILLNVMYAGERYDIDPLFVEALDSSLYNQSQQEDEYAGWPYSSYTTAVQMYEQRTGLTATITYLAIYIGFILLIACAAILSLQQLSEAADNTTRYALLEKIGVERKMMNRALLTQIAIYFTFPLVVALCHSLVALRVIADLIQIISALEIVEPLVFTLLLFVLVYGGYFLITYFASRTVIHQRS